MLLVPYRAKNPPDSRPYCTVALIAVNVLVYLCTTRGLVVTDGAIDSLAVTADNLSLWRLLTSMFLHADIFHIGFNMLFLWIFGAAVEGRLRHWRFLLLYFGAGLLGGWLSTLYYGRMNPGLPGFGASGAIMGALGAYLYMFPFSNIKIFWWFFIRVGIAEVLAFWLIGFFVLKDLFAGVIFHTNDGVGHIAHLSGFGLGYAGALGMRARVDNERASKVKSTLAEIGDVSLLNFRELDALLQHPTDNPALVLAYCHRCAAEGEGTRWPEQMSAMMRRYQTMLVDQTDPLATARLLLMLPPDAPIPFPGVAYLRIGSRLEQASQFDAAGRLYRRLYELNRTGRDAETTLYRLARLLETAYSNPKAAAETYREQLRLFPAGSLALSARDALARQGRTAHTIPEPQPQIPVQAQPNSSRTLLESAKPAPSRPIVIPAQLPNDEAQSLSQSKPQAAPEPQPLVNGLDFGSGRKIEL